MFNPAQQGFGRYASNSGFKALGAAPGLNYEAGAELGSAALAAKAKIKAAKYQADATRYQGRQARNSAIFGGAMDLVGSLGGAAIGSGMFSGGGGGVDFSATDAQAMGMNPVEAAYRQKGGATYWDSSMPTNQFKPMGFGSSFKGF